LFQSSTANQSLDHLLNCFDKLLNGTVNNPPSKSNKNGKASRSKDQQKGASEGIATPHFTISDVKNLLNLLLY